MRETVKFSTINSKYLPRWDEAIPGRESFSESAALEYVRANILKTLGWINEAGRCGADICCTNEDFPAFGAYVGSAERFASVFNETVGYINKELSKIAKRYNMHIAANYYRACDGKLYNTSTLFGRDGSETGQYRKVHLPGSERVTACAGDTFPVFDTDIGKIGFATCYDMIFPEHCRLLALNGADIIIHQTQGWGTGGKSCVTTGEAFMRVRAAENAVYLIVSKNIQREGGSSLIADNAGNVLAQAPVGEECVVYAETGPDYDMMDEYLYTNIYTGVLSTRARQLLVRRPELYSGISSTKPPAIDKYSGMSICDSLERVEEINKEIADADPEKRSKFYWYQVVR